MFMANDERAAYRSTGKVSWPRFLPVAGATLLVAVVAAIALSALFLAGHYLVFLAPFVAFLPVVGIMYLAINVGRCRNKVIAVMFAVTTACVTYLGYYHATLVRTVGAWAVPRVDFLVPYIRFRMATDVVVDDHAPANAAPRLPSKGMNWFGFGIESVSLLALSIGVALPRSSRAYCESCRHWTDTRKLKYGSGTGQAIMNALQNGSPEEIRTLKSTPIPAQTSCCELTVEYCANAIAGGDSCPVYLSLRDVAGSSKLNPLSRLGGLLQNRRGPRMSWLMLQVVLEPKEVVALAPVFTDFKSLPMLKDVPAGPVMSEVPIGRPGRELAIVEKVPPPHAGNVLSRGTVIVGSLIALSPFLLGMASGIGMFGIAGAYGDKLPNWATVGVGGFAVLLLTLAYSLYFSDYLPSKYLMGKCTQQLDRRVDCWVDHRDHDAIAVQVVPRENWGRVMLENASDVGFLRIDPRQRELVFEGDKERYRIPAKSITSCEIESFAAAGDQHGKQLFFMTVIQAMTANGPWEASIAHRHVMAKRRGTKQREQLAQELHRQICDATTDKR